MKEKKEAGGLPILKQSIDPQGTTCHSSVNKNHTHSHVPTTTDVFFHSIRQAYEICMNLVLEKKGRAL